ncbi:hypothetical protein AAMO2058_001735000 [Amorphochlora amoebiformis]
MMSWVYTFIMIGVTLEGGEGMSTTGTIRFSRAQHRILRSRSMPRLLRRGVSCGVGEADRPEAKNHPRNFQNEFDAFFEEEIESDRPFSEPQSEPQPKSFRIADDLGDHMVSNTYNNVKVYRCNEEEFLLSTLQRWKYLPQICVCGVSNAGKSSLINHLLKKNNLAKASSVTGKTRSVDLFVVNNRFILVDLPGFPGVDGQASRLWSEEFEPLVQVYFNEAPDLRAMLFAHDVRWAVTTDETKYLEAANSLGLQTLVLMTKDDRVEHRERNWGLARFRQDTGYDGKHVHYCSDNSLATCRKARRLALKFIDSVCKKV